MTVLSILFALAAAMVLPLHSAAAGMLKDVPDAIVCAVGNVHTTFNQTKPATSNKKKEDPGEMVVYVARRMDDGSTLYESLEREFETVITVDAKGILHWENRPDCDGKSVQQLRDEGRAFDFAR